MQLHQRKTKSQLVAFIFLFALIFTTSPSTFGQMRHLPSVKFEFFPQLSSFLQALNKHQDEFPEVVKKRSSLYNELTSFGFSGKDVSEIHRAALPYFNMNRLLPGTPFRFLYERSPFVQWSGVEFKLSPRRFLVLSKNKSQDGQDQWTAQHQQLQIKTRIASFSGMVTTSLWKSAEQAQMDPELIANLTEIFAWQIDFSRQVNENDSWRLVVEEEIINNQPVGWGKILAAEYHNGSNIYEAYYYNKNGYEGYFAKDGKSSTRTLLRTPIEFARISSGFSLRRFHPQLKIIRPHLGVDYAAARGTPIRSVGDGKVTEARYTVSGGKTISIEHNSVYKTRYMHLNGFATKIAAGSFVKQGQIIGYVGSTGLSTGPHLHFEFYEHGTYKDPLKVNLPPAKSIPSNLLSDFQRVAGKWIAMLPSWPRQIAGSF